MRWHREVSTVIRKPVLPAGSGGGSAAGYGETYGSGGKCPCPVQTASQTTRGAVAMVVGVAPGPTTIPRCGRRNRTRQVAAPRRVPAIAICPRPGSEQASVHNGGGA